MLFFLKNFPSFFRGSALAQTRTHTHSPNPVPHGLRCWFTTGAATSIIAVFGVHVGADNVPGSFRLSVKWEM